MVQPRSRGPTEFLTLQSSCIHGPTPLARAYRGGPGHVGAFHGSNPARAGLPKRSRPPAKRSERSNPARAGLPVRCWAGAVHSSVQTRSRGPTSFLADAEKLNAGPTPLARAYRHQPARNPARQDTVQPRSRGPTANRLQGRPRQNGPTPLARAYRQPVAPCPRTSKQGPTPLARAYRVSSWLASRIGGPTPLARAYHKGQE